MKIELLNVKIEIQKNSVVTDQYANRKNAWTPFYTCHATVSAEAPKEDSEAGLIIDGSKADFTVRYCKAAAEVTSTEYRILFNGQLSIDKASMAYRAQPARDFYGAKE